ncbi:MAG: RidA family protein [Candidatus Solibacter usitatus]|nr:RidA family protein [Candidatus Solibacter usitatus]
MFKTTLTVLWVSLTLLASLAAAQKRVVAPPGEAANRPFSAALMVGDTLYVSGMVGRTPDGKVPDNFEDEVKQTLENIGVVLKAGGLSFADAVAVQVYLTDMTLFERMNGVYVKYFPEPRPTRTTVGVAKLVGTYKIEITVTARDASAVVKPKKKKKK